LPEALKSVANQSYPHWKCWIAEDGESKETYEAVKPFLRDDRFVYLPGTHAGFPAVPRNRGIREGTAPYIAPLDDDLWLPRKLENQVAFLESHSNCVLLGCNGFIGKGTKELNIAEQLMFICNNIPKVITTQITTLTSIDRTRARNYE
jgi:glycosyltransferase involved in cell wall biosynthesis